MAGPDTNRRLLADLLAGSLPTVRYRPPEEATYLAWLDCLELALPDDRSAVFLERGRVALYAGPRFGAADRGFVRRNFATHPDIITEAVNRMSQAVAAIGWPVAPSLSMW